MYNNFKLDRTVVHLIDHTTLDGSYKLCSSSLHESILIYIYNVEWKHC